MKKRIIIIPGLGDRTWLYCLPILLYKMRGFDVEVFSFMWNDPEVSLKKSTNELKKVIQNNNGKFEIHIIGISAGGAAAVWALRNKYIKSCVTIASPFSEIKKARRFDKLLKLLVNNEEFLRTNSDKNRILSIYGIYDQVVPVRTSRKFDIRKKQIPTFFHGPTIAFGIMFFAGKIEKFFED